MSSVSPEESSPRDAKRGTKTSTIIHVIRTNRIPFLQSRASWPLMVTTAIIMAIGAWLPSSPIGPWLGFTPLPLLYWPLLALTLFCYVLLTQGVKMWLIRKAWI